MNQTRTRPRRIRSFSFAPGDGRFTLPSFPAMMPLAGLGLLLLLAYGVLMIRQGDGRVDVPAGSGRIATASGPFLVVVEVDAGGDIRVDGRPVAEGELARRLRSSLRRVVEPREWGVLLRVDARAEYARVAAVVAAVNDAGFGHVAFATGDAPER